MAKSKGVWGIDIGQSGLKALRCELNETGDVVADSYDFIEYPKALSLPDADEEALITEALETFLSRNDLKGDFVSMTVSGQSGLSRFFKPPPVDSRTLPEIVKYEVRQQIPFPIEDVIWDWQSLGGTMMDNVIVDAEVGLFAIKRDTVYSALQPFLNKDIEVDVVQLSPLAVNNVICYELLPELIEGEEIDVDNLPDSMVILSMGTDATDLIVTNGVKLWLRNIPIGGSHFTKELSRELKLTQAKAEHLKRNARQAEDPKTVFQAMRRVFNDLKKEIERSLSYYAGIDKNASLDKIVLMGNAARLPGLRQYLTKQLEMDIAKVSSFDRLSGPVTEERVFKENILSFAPVYGLCLQGLKKARVDTNLLPVEFINERIIRAKKPWVLASVSLLMLGMLFSYFFVNQQWWAVNKNFTREGVSWEQATTAVTQQAGTSFDFKEIDTELNTRLNRVNAISAELAEASETQAAWPEFLSAINQLLPRDPRLVNESGELMLSANPELIPFLDREEIFIDKIESVFQPNLQTWLDTTLGPFRDQQGIKVKKSSRLKATEFDVGNEGFVIEIEGHHFYNGVTKREVSEHGKAFLFERFLVPLLQGEVDLKNGKGVMEKFKMTDLGIYYPTMVYETEKISLENMIANPNFGLDVGEEADDEKEEKASGDEAKEEPKAKEKVKEFEAPRYDFRLQMIFLPTSVEDRDKARDKRLKLETKQKEDAAKKAGKSADDE